MDTSRRIESLERSVRQLQPVVFALLFTLVCVGVLGASGACVPQELTLRKLTIVDADGKARFRACE